MLTRGRPVFWTWIQNHLPEWYAAEMAAAGPDPRPDARRPAANGVRQAGAVVSTSRRDLPPVPQEEGFADPVGPQPEQVKLLAYLSLAAGCRGLGFWSDRYLADSHHGRDRLQQMALLNTELRLIEPVLLKVNQDPIELPTSHPEVRAFLLMGTKGALLLPIWVGSGSQYVPAQAAVLNLTITVPLVADGADPWLITPAGPECLRHQTRKDPRGVVLTIPEFDLVSPVVFTDDLTPTGLVVWWQDQARLALGHWAP